MNQTGTTGDGTTPSTLIDFGDLGQLEYADAGGRSAFWVHDGFGGTACLPLSDRDALVAALAQLPTVARYRPAQVVPHAS